jgi:sulfite exporter TauE/SafE
MVPPTYLMIGGLMATFGALQGWEEALTFEVVVVTGLGLLIAVWGIDLWRKGSGR